MYVTCCMLKKSQAELVHVKITLLQSVFECCTWCVWYCPTNLWLPLRLCSFKICFKPVQQSKRNKLSRTFGEKKIWITESYMNRFKSAATFWRKNRGLFNCCMKVKMSSMSLIYMPPRKPRPFVWNLNEDLVYLFVGCHLHNYTNMAVCGPNLEKL